MAPKTFDLLHPFVEIASMSGQQGGQNAARTGSGDDTEGQRGPAGRGTGDSLEHTHLIGGTGATARQDDGGAPCILWPLGY